MSREARWKPNVSARRMRSFMTLSTRRYDPSLSSAPLSRRRSARNSASEVYAHAAGSTPSMSSMLYRMLISTLLPRSCFWISAFARSCKRDTYVIG
eukprot:816340-Pyramimonas_sp.AAC.2